MRANTDETCYYPHKDTTAIRQVKKDFTVYPSKANDTTIIWWAVKLLPICTHKTAPNIANSLGRCVVLGKICVPSHRQICHVVGGSFII